MRKHRKELRGVGVVAALCVVGLGSACRGNAPEVDATAATRGQSEHLEQKGASLAEETRAPSDGLAAASTGAPPPPKADESNPVHAKRAVGPERVASPMAPRGGLGAASLASASPLEANAAGRPAVEEAAIDPNARFATTYRPGGGHLAAFESAVARGIVPAADRELVGDLGARYAVAMDAPTGSAMGFRGVFEREKLAPSGGPVHLRLDLRSIDKSAAERPHLSVVVVLDVSGSMRGELIQSARQAASALVDKLDERDDFALVTFSTSADVKIPIGRVGARKDALKQTIGEIVENGGTNIGEGLRLGYEQVKDKKVSADAVKVVFLLSDGRANNGITNRSALSQLANDAFQDGIQTSSFGLGTDYDGPLMSSIANDGAGGYYYLRDGAQIAPALATELEKRLDPVATALELRVRLKPGVELLNVYGSRRLSETEAARVRAIEVAQDAQAAKRDKIAKNRQDDADGGMRFFIPAFARNDAHSILLKLRLPEGVGPKDVALVEVKYKDRIFKKNVSDEVPLKIAYANSDAESAQTIDPSVARTVQGFAAGDTLMKAANAIALGDRATAARLLAEREGILQQAATTLDEPLFVIDAMRLARLRIHADDPKRAADPLTLAMVMETAGGTHLR